VKYGSRLVSVRYRYDEPMRKRYKTIELIVEEADWTPRRMPATGSEMVSIRVRSRSVSFGSG
jgi:hypothetical protein